MDKKNALREVEENGLALRDMNDLNNDKEIVLAAVNQDGYALTFASDHLKNDKEVVLTAVQKDGTALSFASDHLKNDKEVVLEAVQQQGSAINYASDDLKEDKSFLKKCLLLNGDCLDYLVNKDDIQLRAFAKFSNKPNNIPLDTRSYDFILQKRAELLKIALGALKKGEFHKISRSVALIHILENMGLDQDTRQLIANYERSLGKTPLPLNLREWSSDVLSEVKDQHKGGRTRNRRRKRKFTKSYKSK